MLAWGGDVSTCWDAKQLQRAVGSPSAPYLAMVSMPSQDVVNLVASWEGRVDAARLANELLLSLERFGPELAAVQRRQEEERSRREADRRIREEQVR